MFSEVKDAEGIANESALETVGDSEDTEESLEMLLYLFCICQAY